MSTENVNTTQGAATSSSQAQSAADAQQPVGCPMEHWREVVQLMPDEEMLYDLADLFKVFADTTRIKILYSLMEDEMCVSCIAEAVGISQSAVSHQLRLLKASRLVKFRREGKQVLYSLSDDHVHTMLAQGMNHICE